MKAHLAYLITNRFLSAGKHPANERKATMDIKAHINGLGGFARHVGRARHTLWLLASVAALLAMVLGVFAPTQPAAAEARLECSEHTLGDTLTPGATDTFNVAFFAGGLHATEHAAIGILPLFALCDRNDIGGVSTPLHPDTGQAQIFIYDGHPGGVGIAERGYDLIETLWEATLKTIRECPCFDGCPSCIQSPKCGNNNQPLDKKAARILLEALLGYVKIS